MPPNVHGFINIVCFSEMIVAGSAGIFGLVVLGGWFTLEAYGDLYPYKVEELIGEIRTKVATDPVDQWLVENFFHEQVSRRMMVVVILIVIVVIDVVYTIALWHWVEKMNPKGLTHWMLVHSLMCLLYLPAEILIMVHTTWLKIGIVSAWIAYSGFALVVVAKFAADVAKYQTEEDGRGIGAGDVPLEPIQFLESHPFSLRQNGSSTFDV